MERETAILLVGLSAVIFFVGFPFLLTWQNKRWWRKIEGQVTGTENILMQQEITSLNRVNGELKKALEACRKEKDNAWALLAKAREGRTLQYLKSVSEHIRVSVDTFSKDSFFGRKGPVKLYFWPNFTNWILSAIPDSIPAFTTTLSSFTLTRNMSDTDILAELGNPTPFTVSEFAAIMKGLLTKQPRGEAGDLLTNGSANIFYVLLEDGRTVAVDVHWYGDDRGWICGAYDLGDWSAGFRVFLRNSTPC